MKRLVLVLLLLLLLAGCGSISPDQFAELQENVAALENYDDSALLEEIATLQAELAAMEEELSAIEDFDDTALLTAIVALQTELAAIEDFDDTALLEEISVIQAELGEIEEFDDTTLLASIAALQTELDAIEDFDDTSLLAAITSLQTEVAILASFVRPVFLNIPENQIIQPGEELDLLSLGLTAIDNSDGDITNSITVNIVDTTQLNIGSHNIIYSVSDSDGNVSTEEVNLIVTVDSYYYFFSYIYNDNVPEIEIVTYKAQQIVEAVIPRTIGGIPVTSIGASAFFFSEINSVIIPDSVTTIKDHAFFFSELTFVTIPDSVITIGDYAFTNNRLATITIPNSVVSIGDNAFSGNPFTSIIISESVVTIGDEAFAGSNNLITSVTILGDETRFNSRWTEIGFPIELMP